jgi:Ca2+:H+ antiporter
MSLNWLLVFVPIAIGLNWFGASPILVFAASALAIMPLAELMGKATESLSKTLGDAIGGLLNASLNNAPEIIIAGFALHQGLVPIVKAALTGSIVTNLLFGLGMAMFAGGLRYRRQSFDPNVAHMNCALLILASFGLIIPAAFRFSAATEEEISLEISVILFLVYLASLAYTLITSKAALGKDAAQAELKEKGERPDEVEEPRRGMSRNSAIGLLVVVTLVLAVMSEVMTGAIEPTARSLGLTPVFAGVFLLSFVSNVPQLYNAVAFARKDKMDLAIGVTLGASTQVGLLVAPLLVFLGVAFGQDMNLVFSRFELVAIIFAVFVTRILIFDGASNWLEGLMLVAVYLMLGVGFFYAPGVEPGAAPRPVPPAAASSTKDSQRTADLPSSRWRPSITPEWRRVVACAFR